MRKTLALFVIVLALVALSITPASAATRIACLANGVVNVDGTGPYSWTVLGTGTCLDTLQGNFLISFIGSGSSNTLGLCGGLVVQGLKLTVNQEVTNIRTGVHTFSTQSWQAPLTTFPVVTPFLIKQGGLVGAGAIFTRLLLKCPIDGGSNVATFVFTTVG